ncbi:retrotransposon protein, putative, ty1-copia subclass [Tanacetum coccineum]|uniref:Retrotransposon protein, putative, ty1-copia subclass n=1 Tax=Tanacetum coccineum TaxID=301880 RepID=A0ABQ5H335_9ASTR
MDNVTTAKRKDIGKGTVLFLGKGRHTSKESGRIVELEDEDILPSENTSEHPIEEEKSCPNCLSRRGLAFAWNAEMKSMYDNKVWRLVVLPPNAKVVKSKWIYKKKTDMDGKESIVKRMQNVPYASAVGSIMYVVRCTRPDVAFAQNITSRFQQNSGEAHWTAVKNILKYLRNTKDTFLVYGGDPEAELRVNCYCDAGFETDRDDTKSQTGYVFVLNGGAVVWKSSKQSTTAQHATEAEYIAASEAAKEVVWIRKFIDELGVVPSNDYPIKMNCDNSAAIIMAKESGIQKGARHFKRKYHYVRECIETGEIDIVKVHTDDNLADPFTKALAGPKLTRHAKKHGSSAWLSIFHMALNNAQTKTNSSAFRSMLEKHQLTGPNFNEWLRALKLVVRTEKLQDVFETPLPPAPAASVDNQALANWNALFDRHNEVACLMLGTMSPKLYQQFENKSPQEMITELQKMYGKPSGVEL